MNKFTGLPMLAQFPRWARGPARIVEDEVVLDEGRARPYYIYENGNEIMFDFADLAADLDNLDERDVLDFVRWYGLLWHGAEELGTGSCRESLADVWAEARWFAELLEIYVKLKDAVRTGSADWLRQRVNLQRSSGTEAVDDQVVMARASIQLGEAVTKALAGCTHGVVSTAIGHEEFSSPDRFLLSIRPQNLLSLAYVRFAQVMVARVPLVECAGCGRMFAPESGKQKYCTQSCASTSRWRRWKERQSAD